MNTAESIKSSLKANKYPLILLSIYCVLVAFFCSKMSPLYPINEWSDVNLYFNIGKAIANGKVLYLEAFDHKGPLIFFLYAIGYIISNDSFFGMFLIESFAWIILSFTAYYTGRLFLNKFYSFLAAIAFFPFFLSHTESGGSAEEFITVCIGISLYLFIRYFRKPQDHDYRFMLVHGMMWCMVLLTKFTLTSFWIPTLLALGIILLMQKRYKNLFLNIVYFLLGGMIVAVPLLVYFLLTNSLGDAIEAYITVNISFAEAESGGSMLMNIIVRFYQRLRFETIEFSVILLGALVFPIVFIKNNIAKIGLALGFFAIFSIAVMSIYYFYYSIPYYIYCIPGIIVLAYYFEKYIIVRPIWHLILVFVFIGVCVSIGRKDYFGIHSRVLARKEKPTGMIFEFAEIINKEKNPTLLNMTLNEGNTLFTLCNIVPNIRYFITPNLSYEQYPQMRDEQDKYIENKEVMFVLMRSNVGNYEHFKSFEPLYENYEVIAEYGNDYDYYSGKTRRFYLFKRK